METLMNCPICLELNVFSKVVTLSTVQFCENELCLFCQIDDSNNETSITKLILFPNNNNNLLPNINEFYKTEEYYYMAKNTKLPVITNHTNYILDTNITEKKSVSLQTDTNLEFSDNNTIYNGNCPLCFKFNILSKIIYSFGTYVCENESCVFCETQESFIDRLNTKEDGEERVELLPDGSPDRNMTLIENSMLENIKLKDQGVVENIEIIDLSKELNNFSQFENSSVQLSVIGKKKEKTSEKVIKTRKIRFSNNLKHNIIEQSLVASLDSSFYQFNNKLFNWLRMPYFMKVHSKIVRILLLHLDVFKFKDNLLIDDIKREYSVCETLANQFPIEDVKPLCYRFMNSLYAIIDKIPNHHLICKEMDDRVIDLLQRLFEKYDCKKALKQEYTTEFSCSFCGDKGLVNSKAYILSLKRNRFRIKIKENKLIHDINCLKCKNVSKETISFKRVPEFVIFHYPKGLREDIGKYENKITTDDNRNLSIVGIVECGSKYPFREEQENPTSFVKYNINDVTMDNRFRPSYTVHIRNKRGWYSLNGYKQFLCSPQETLPSFVSSDVRFIIFGVISDPQVYRHRFSLQEFRDSHAEFAREKIIEDSLSIPNETLTNKIINDKSNVKSKPKRKLKRCIRTDENMMQIPNILDQIYYDHGKENKIVTESNSNQLNMEKLVLSSSQLPSYALSGSPVQFVGGYIYGNTSSVESSNSSVLGELDGLQLSKKRKLNDLQSQSTSSFSSNISPVQSRSATQNAMFNIDSLISKTSRKIRQTSITVIPNQL